MILAWSKNTWEGWRSRLRIQTGTRDDGQRLQPLPKSCLEPVCEDNAVPSVECWMPWLAVSLAMGRKCYLLPLMSLEIGSFCCYFPPISRTDSPLFLLICVIMSLFKVQGRGIWLIKARVYALLAVEAGRGVSWLFSFCGWRWMLSPTKILKMRSLQW